MAPLLPFRIPVKAYRHALALSCLLGCMPLTTPAQAWPGENGVIAFSRISSTGADIWIERPSGRQRQLTGGPANDAEPTYSPDGRMIAFVRYSGTDSDIWLMNSDGTNERPLTDTDGNESEPAFFPSGRSLVFATSAYVGGWNVFSIEIDGTGLREQADSARSPVVSPDGRWLAYWRHPGGERIRMKNLRTGEERQLPTGVAQEPDFSPDGRTLVFVGKRPCKPQGELRLALLTIGLNDRRPRVLLPTCQRRFIPSGPAWSPRGDKIVFTRRENPIEPVDIRLAIASPGGAQLAGAPRHRHDTFETSPSWQPLR